MRPKAPTRRGTDAYPELALTQFRVHDRPVPAGSAATHAIVIGVGHYPHLIGGGKRLTISHDTMGQLSSPTASARAFATWLIKELDDPMKPLASVALLLAERRRKPFRNPKTRKNLSVAAATMENVAKAIVEWKSAGDESSSNRLIFYFCGHGIAQGASVALLLSDYGSNDNDVLTAALDFMRFRTGMDACAAREQVYFVDACRASSDTLLAQLGRAGEPVIAPNPNLPRPPTPAAQPIFYSTLAGAKAYGAAGKPSVFTDALLRSLRGAGADDTNGDWRVETSQLNRAIDVYMRREIESGRHPRAQVPATVELTTFELHRLKDPPVVPTLVRCVTDQETRLARFSYVPSTGGRPKTRRPAAVPWEVDLAQGEYTFSARMPNQPARSRTVTVRPVERRVTLEPAV